MTMLKFRQLFQNTTFQSKKLLPNNYNNSMFAINETWKGSTSPKSKPKTFK